MAYKLAGCFALVYLVGRIPRFRNFVFRNTSHDPLSGRVSTLFTSQFGHGGLVHLGINSFVLVGFGTYNDQVQDRVLIVIQPRLHGHT